jgi:hypothetical protein
VTRRSSIYNALKLLFILSISYSLFFCNDSKSPDTTSPIIIITSPQNMEIVSEVVQINCKVSDDSGIEYLELVIDAGCKNVGDFLGF